MELQAGDIRVPLAQLAHNFAIPIQPIELPAGAAVIVMTIDGEITRMPVFLQEVTQAGRILLEQPREVNPS
jgi:formyltetrahydrofolate synthetase